MNTNFNQGSAKIYQFPTSAERAANKTKSASEFAPRANIAVGESWYHQEAIQEDMRARTVIVPFTSPRQ